MADVGGRRAAARGPMTRPVLVLLLTFGRLALMSACAFATLVAINAAQRRMLPPADSLDIMFDRLGYAMGGAFAAALIAVAFSVRWGRARFGLGARLLQSGAAVLLAAVPFLTV